MPSPSAVPLFNSQVPVAPNGHQNTKWQTDGGSPVAQLTTNVPYTGGVSVKTTSYTAADTDCGNLIVFNSSSAVTLTLPAAIPFAQWCIFVANIGTGSLSISPNGLQIDGSLSTLTGFGQFSGAYIATDGTNYFSERNNGGSGGVGGVNVQTISYTLLAADAGKIVVYNGSGAGTFTLPATPPTSVWNVFVANISSQLLTLNPNSLTLDGSASNLQIPPLSGIYISTNGTNYFSVRGLDQYGGVNVQTIAYTLVESDVSKIVVYNGSTVATFKLPATPPSSTWRAFVANTSTHVLTLDPNGPNLDGSAATLAIPPNSSVYVSTNGTNYFSVRGLDQQGGTKVITSTGYNVLPGDSGLLLVYNNSSAGNFFLSTPTPWTSSWRVFVQNIGTGQLTINRGATTIDGASSNLLLNQGEGLYITSDGSNYFTSRGAPVQPYNWVCFLPGKPSGTPDNQVFQWTCTGDLPYGVNIAANWGGFAQGFCQVAPTATATYTIFKITAGSSPGTVGTQIGTIVISTSGVFTFATTSGSAYSFAVGDTMTVWAPNTQDASLAGVGFVLVGTR